MKLITSGSGSSGNCYLINVDGHYLALDAGMKWRDVQIACGFRVSAIDACLITHEHGDHAQYYRHFNKNGIPVYAEDRTAKNLKIITGEYVRSLASNKITRIIGHYKVIPIRVPHEDTPNSGFLIEFDNGERLLYVTDFEYIPVTVKTWKINHFLIAVNHSEEIDLEDEAREHRLRGHSSLEVVKNFLDKSISDKCRNVIACHLSDKYANEEKIISGLREVCGDSIKVNIARKGESIDL
jgi:phosphoribosyl 1,2-cyclic phosphodiesterase